ncbi:collagen alpha-5(VI) chain-like [Porites lutea]|uniref:collagen alpha-5(VI) chain-like n=1 Tax=Porites lutea TaxID=51062 RepID=UPI003CC51EB3
MTVADAENYQTGAALGPSTKTAYNCIRMIQHGILNQQTIQNSSEPVLIEQLSRLVIHLSIHFTPEEKTFDYIKDKFASLLILTAILACTCSFPSKERACDIDLGLVIDDTKGNFSLIKNFTKHLVSKFQISDNGTRVGAITFGRTANLRLRFSDLKGRENNLESVKKQIDSWHEDPPLPNVNNIYFHSNISEALRVAKDFLFTNTSGVRSRQVEQVLVMFKDGKQDKGGLRSSEPLELRNKGIEIITVGIEKPDPIELVMIAGGKFKNVHWLNSPDRIKSVASEIVQSVCSEA